MARKSTKTNDAEFPASEAQTLATGGLPYFRTLQLFFTDPEDLGRRIEARAWDGISKPLAAGSASAAVATLAFWLLDIEERIGKFWLVLVEIPKNPPFFLAIIGLVFVLQLAAKRSLTLHTLLSQAFALVYALAFFILPFCIIIVLLNFSQKLLSLGEWPMLLSLLLIAPLAGYTVIFGLMRLFAGVLATSYTLIFWVFMIYGVAVVKFADHFFPLWQFR